MEIDVQLGGGTGAGDASAANQVSEQALIGAVNESAPATDIASSGLNGRLQRIAQRLTSLIALFPSSIGQKAAAGSLSVVLASDSTAATSAKQDTGNTSVASIDTKTPALGQALAASSVPVTLTALEEGLIGALTETAPGSDTASSGMNGRLQRIAQRLTSMIALLPASLGQKAMASSLAVTVASDQTSFPVTVAAGSAIIGKVGIDQTTPGTTNLVALAANQSVNNAQIAGVTTATGNGVVGTGVQRVAIASDNTAFTVNSANFGTASSTNACSSLASTALEASHIIKASAGRLYQLTGVNTKSSAQYIQVFNSTTVPVDTTAPVLLAYVPANSTFSFDFGDLGRYFSTGISVSNSSTAATKTIGSADCWFNAEYV